MTQALAVVPSLSPQEAQLLADLEQGFRNRHAALNHKEASVELELRCIRQFTEFTGWQPPWRWRNEAMDAYGAALQRAGKARETMRHRQGGVRRFLGFARDPGYPWNARCLALTGMEFPQICTPENTVRHQRGAPTSKRRRLLAEELDQLFLFLIERIAAARTTRDYLARCTHYVLIALALGTGLREQELAMMDLADLSSAVTPEIQQYSPFEGVFVRFGKSHDGGPAKQRSVTAPYLFRDAFQILEWFLSEIRPQVARKNSPPALFLNIRGARFRPDSISTIFHAARVGAEISPDIAMHCLRHTFETLLHESGMPLAVRQKLLGHESLATTQIYDHLGDDFIKSRMLAHQRELVERAAMWRKTTGA
jgi:site-specific recombinase XerD